MKVPVNKIKVNDRIRKDYGNIQELADDIQENQLINPLVITPDNVLIAGERRLKACKLLGFTEIEVRVMKVFDYEHQLRLEISENEQRKDLTTSERIAYGREWERIEAEKARKRQIAAQNNNTGRAVTEKFPELQNGQGETRDIVAAKVGLGSGRTYSKARYVVNNAPAEIVTKMDAKELSIDGAFKEAKKLEKTQEPPQLKLVKPAELKPAKKGKHQDPDPAGQELVQKLDTLLKDFAAYVNNFETQFSNIICDIPDLHATGIRFYDYLRMYRHSMLLIEGSIQLKKHVEKRGIERVTV